MQIFQTSEEGIIELIPEAKALVPFKKLIIRDKGSKGDVDGRKKYHAIKEIAFVYWYAKFDSPYDQYEEPEKTKQITKSVGLEDWKPDKDIYEAIDFFKGLQRTKSMDYLEDSEFALKRLSKYLRDADPDERIQSGPHKDALVHDLNKIKNLQKEMPDMIEATEKIKELVKKELQETTQNRAGRETNDWTE